MTDLLAAVRRHAPLGGEGAPCLTPIAGLYTVHATAPTGMMHAVARPLACLVVQGAKKVTVGAKDYPFAAGDSLLITADVPVVGQITRASVMAPYLSLSIELDPAVIADLGAEMGAGAVGDPAPVRVDPTDAEVADAALRLLQLLDRPAAIPVLATQLMREVHYWLLAGRHGAAIRRLGWPNGHAHQIARAVAVLRADYAQSLPIERLAAIAGMSASSFHQHFRAHTSLSPRQFQKQLRLIEARRLMLDGAPAGHAAFTVGYESVPQFTRDYGRMFGAPPVRDTVAARASMAA